LAPVLAGVRAAAGDFERAEPVPAQGEGAERVQWQPLDQSGLDHVTIAVAVGQAGNAGRVTAGVHELPHGRLALTDGGDVPAGVQSLHRLGGGMHPTGDMDGTRAATLIFSSSSASAAASGE
jgi:hypothetical protein